MFEGLLIHQAEIRRKLVKRTDRFGQPVKTDEPFVLAACRLTRPSGGEASSERSRDLYEVTHTVYLPRGTDVFEDDIITVRDGAGTVLVEDAHIKIKKVVYDGVGPHHLELTVTSQRGPL